MVIASPPQRANRACSAQGCSAISFSASTARITTTYAGTAPDQTLTVAVVLPYRPLIGLLPVPARARGASGLPVARDCFARAGSLCSLPPQGPRDGDPIGHERSRT